MRRMLFAKNHKAIYVRQNGRQTTKAENSSHNLSFEIPPLGVLVATTLEPSSQSAMLNRVPSLHFH